MQALGGALAALLDIGFRQLPSDGKSEQPPMLLFARKRGNARAQLRVSGPATLNQFARMFMIRRAE
jgi:hypothetical protein